MNLLKIKSARYAVNLRLLALLFISLPIAAGYADVKNPPETVKQLVHWETRSNGASVRSEAPIALLHYEIPISEITSDFTQSIDPKVYKSLVFKKGDQTYVRWIINPEDTKWHLKVAEYLTKKGLDPTPKKYFTGFLTSSRSLIVADPESGATFSAKASTNNTGGNWTDKKQPFDDAFQARRSSDMISDVQRRVKFDHMILLEEPGMFGIESIDQAILFRSLGDLPTSDHYYLPGFSALHDETGEKIARLNGSRNPEQYWDEHYNKTLARAYAELSAHFGLTYDSPHSQNFLIELDKNYKPTGKIIFRDFVDGYAQSDFLKAAHQDEFLKIWDKGNITKGNLDASVGVLHGNVYPSWIDDRIYKEWGNHFYEAYEDEFSKITGIDRNYLKNARLNQNGRYFSKSYTTTQPAWKTYLEFADCYYGFIKTRAGLDCPEKLVSKILPKFREAQHCSGLFLSAIH